MNFQHWICGEFYFRTKIFICKSIRILSKWLAHIQADVYMGVQGLYNFISILDSCCWQFTKSGSKCQCSVGSLRSTSAVLIPTKRWRTLCSQSDANLFELTSESRSGCSVTGLCLSRYSLKPWTKVVNLLLLYWFTKQLFICTYKS